MHRSSLANRRHLSRRLCALVSLASSLTLPSVAPSQSVRGTVTDGSGRGVPGIVLQLLDSTGATVASTLSDEAGRYAVLAPRSGTYGVRARRIGYRPELDGPIVITAGESKDFPIALAGVRVSLEAVRVEAAAVCGKTAESADRSAFDAWDQAMSSLASALVIAGADGLEVRLLSIERTMDSDGRRIREQEAIAMAGPAREPWASLPPAVLRADGYAVVETDGTTRFHAPDLRVLSSTEFLEDHCLRAIASADTGEYGVRFEPTPERRHAPEIEGTVWLTRASSALRRVEFRYLNVPGWPEPPPMRAEGRLDFAMLPGGGVLISRWEIRMPVLEKPTPQAPRVRVTAVLSSGGEVVLVQRGRDTVFVRSTVALRGIVRDSATNQPVPNSSVMLVGSGRRTITDGDGRFIIEDVLPGEYVVAVSTPSLAEVRASVLSVVVIADGIADLTLRAPTAPELAAMYCGRALDEGDRIGAVFGHVDFGRETAEIADIPVVAEWIESTRVSAGSVGPPGTLRRIETRTNPQGGFRLCGLPSETAITIRARPLIGRSESSIIRIPRRRRFASVRVAVDPDRVGAAVFRGLVVQHPDSQPLENVEVSLPALGLTTRTDARGNYRIAEIPPGTHLVTARRIGFGALEARVTFAPNDEEERRILLSDITQLAQVDVIGTMPDMALLEFEEQRRLGLGRFLTRDQLERFDALALPSVLARLPTIRVQAGRGSARYPALGGRNRVTLQALAGNSCAPPLFMDPPRRIPCLCYARVYVDGHLMNSGSPTEPFDVNELLVAGVEAVEWYPTPASTPARYQGLNTTCGVLVIHRRRETEKPALGADSLRSTAGSR